MFCYSLIKEHFSSISKTLLISGDPELNDNANSELLGNILFIVVS
jgi:hypothetical protein